MAQQISGACAALCAARCRVHPASAVLIVSTLSRPASAGAAQATPRSLRSFFDAAPADILDTPFTSLIFVPRQDHDALLGEVAALRTQLAEKDESIQLLQKARADDSSGKAVAVAVDAEQHRAQTVALAAKIETLSRERDEALSNVDEVEAKGRALKSEIAKLRTQLHQAHPPSQTTAGKPPERKDDADGRIKSLTDRLRGMQSEKDRMKNDLENQLRTLAQRASGLQSERDRLRNDNSDASKRVAKLSEDLSIVANGADALGEKYKDLQAERATILADQNTLQDTVARLTQQAESQKNKLDYLENTTMTLRRQNLELTTSCTRHENENKVLIGKNGDLAEENSTLESQNNAFQKEKIMLQNTIDDLTEKKKALEAELKETQSKMCGLQPPTDDIRQRLPLQPELEMTRKELEEVKETVRQQTVELQGLQKEKAVLTAENGDLRARVEAVSEAVRQRLVEERSKIDQSKASNNELPKKVDIIETRGSTPSTPQRTSAAPLLIDAESVANPLATLKRKSLDTPPQHSTPASQPMTPTGEKRQKFDHPDSASTQARPLNIYHLVTNKAISFKPLRDALRATFKDPDVDLQGVTRNTNEWVVKFTYPLSGPRRHFGIDQGHYANLSAITSKNCFLCKGSHDTWYCGELERNKPRASITQRSISDNAQSPAQRAPNGGLDLQSTLSARDKAPETPPSRSLFDRIQSNGTGHEIYPPPSGALAPIMTVEVANRIEELMRDARTRSRALFCNFHRGTPRVDEFLDLISGGPLEFVRLLPDKRVGFVTFVKPNDALRFLSYAQQHLNDRKILYARPADGRGGDVPVTFRFQWSDSARKELDRDIAEGIVRFGWTRVLVIENVPKHITGVDVKETFYGIYGTGGKEMEFFIEPCNENPVTGERDLKLEFTNLRDCAKAYRKLVGGITYGSGVRWGREGCDRQLGAAAPGNA